MDSLMARICCTLVSLVFGGGGGGAGAEEVLLVVGDVAVSRALLRWGFVLLRGLAFFGQSQARCPLSRHWKQRPSARYCARSSSVSF